MLWRLWLLVGSDRPSKQGTDNVTYWAVRWQLKISREKIYLTKQTFSITQWPIGPSGFCQKLPTGRWSFQIYFKFHFNDIKLSLRYEKCDTINGTTDYLDLALSGAFSFSPYFWPPPVEAGSVGGLAASRATGPEGRPGGGRPVSPNPPQSGTLWTSLGEVQPTQKHPRRPFHFGIFRFWRFFSSKSICSISYLSVAQPDAIWVFSRSSLNFENTAMS